mmetsp:Transcript_70769/g.156134  ORF Transcript_70769/g.156134 Transcript_70769/m.156134 type:complete len:371 (+) Transcript_70769:732-1844(+)
MPLHGLCKLISAEIRFHVTPHLLELSSGHGLFQQLHLRQHPRRQRHHRRPPAGAARRRHVLGHEEQLRALLAWNETRTAMRQVSLGHDHRALVGAARRQRVGAEDPQLRRSEGALPVTAREVFELKIHDSQFGKLNGLRFQHGHLLSTCEAKGGAVNQGSAEGLHRQALQGAAEFDRLNARDDHLQVLETTQPSLLLQKMLFRLCLLQHRPHGVRVQLAGGIQRGELCLSQQRDGLWGILILRIHSIEVSNVLGKGSNEGDKTPVRCHLDRCQPLGMKLGDIFLPQQGSSHGIELAGSNLEVRLVATSPSMDQAQRTRRLWPASGGVVNRVRQAHLVDQLRPDVSDLGGIVQATHGGDAHHEDWHQTTEA